MVRSKLDVQGRGSGRSLDVDGQGGWEVLKIGQFSWTPYVYHPLLLLLMFVFSHEIINFVCRIMIKYLSKRVI